MPGSGGTCHYCRKYDCVCYKPGRPDTQATMTVICPWCGHNHSDSWEFDDGRYDCSECGKPFRLAVNTSVTYTTTREADHA